ncbi:hypothetical protein N1851_015124 [Merluccius polli]|uniref:Uncharacterized protein n=1 Tax=Merluccius polli TaxID=89951 RepID=A0AA47P2G4_MERPO|nr:hypothetical protein N1851_030498 [Merluccius polli]KAK0145940.1 hypothetical protein N1851_015124 [Merluccius polli]
MVSTDTVGMGDEPATPDRTMENAERPLNTISSETTREESMLEYSDQPLPSEEDSMIVHPSGLANGSETQSAIHTQSLHILPEFTWVSSGRSGFLPQSTQNMQVNTPALLPISKARALQVELFVTQGLPLWQPHCS